MPGIEVSFEPCSPVCSIVPHFETASFGSESLMMGFAELPSAMITRSASISVVRPVGTGRRRPELSGSPKAMISTVALVTKWVCGSPANSIGERSTSSSMPSSSACSTSSTRAGISARVRR